MKPEELLDLKTFEQVRDDAIADLQTSKFRITNFRPGRIFYTLVEISAKAIDALYKLLAKVIMQLFLSTATGGWLDLVAADRSGVYRKQAQKAIWNVRIGRADATLKATIPEGSIVTTEEDDKGQVLRFLVKTKTILDPGVIETVVQVEAELGGSQYNVGVGQISKFGVFIPGVDYVQNDASGLVLEGTDVETDESLRMRAQNKTVAIAYGGNDYMYKSMAEEIVGVARARINTQQPRGQGTIDAVIIGTEGIPSQTVIDQVVAKYENDGSAIADIAVLPCEIVTVPVTVTIYKDPKRGNADLMKLSAESLISGMFEIIPQTDGNAPQFDPDYGVDRSLIMAARWFIPDVLSMDVIEPAADVKVNFNQLAAPGVITVTVQEV
ncbi:MAG: baseplate J/gp47 family protein [Desulfitobacteriaceae bacterium]|nr:baseplate J/gp47 family protein [Desulfitobacteriaceae bacterium]